MQVWQVAAVSQSKSNNVWVTDFTDCTWGLLTSTAQTALTYTDST
jgi:hypothetical protein